MHENLKNKKIILGVTGSIAAYKSPLLVRELIKAGAEVKVVMTPAAKEFVTPLTLKSVSRNSVAIEMFDNNASPESGAWHVGLAQWADAMLIAPITASTLSKLASGQSDNALLCVAMAMPPAKPLLVSPAMDFDMWLFPATQKNAQILESYGIIVIPPEEGELASGLTGPGRLPEISVILEYLSLAISGEKINYKKSESDSGIKFAAGKDKTVPPEAFATPRETLADSVDKDKWTAELELEKLKAKLSGKSPYKLGGKKVLITAGPTIEQIDDVRFISNFSTGKMGYALARAAQNEGARVTLVSGPVELVPPEGVNVIKVRSAEEMREATIREFSDTDIAILAAAVADFSPEVKFQGKIKKEEQSEDYTIKLKKTTDILAELGKVKSQNQVLVGFALETENEIENAKCKLERKNCDMIVLNSANKPNSGFGGDNNTITIIDKRGKETEFMTMSKAEAAKEVVAAAIAIFDQDNK